MLYLGLTIALFLLRYALAGKTAFSKQVYFIVLVGLFLFFQSIPAWAHQAGCAPCSTAAGLRMLASQWSTQRFSTIAISKGFTLARRRMLT